jgi:hypothetical protein
VRSAEARAIQAEKAVTQINDAIRTPVDKEASVLTNEAEVVAGARGRARAMIDRRPGREPDSFRLTDASGKIFGVFPIDQR